MSYEKNTFMFSEITPIVRTLIKLKENYYLGILGSVKGLGVNDNINGIDTYDLRILIYKGGIILEQMRRTEDCDSDDVIISETFNFDELPEKWPLERTMDCDDFCNAKEFENYVSLKKFRKFTEQFVK